MIEAIFIEAKRLGVLESKIRTALVINSKRKRASEMRAIVLVLRHLGLIPFPTQQLTVDGTRDTSPPTGISIGIRSDGELGLWVNYEAIKIQGDMPK